MALTKLASRQQTNPAVNIPILTADPVSPSNGDMWILEDTTGNGLLVGFFGAMPITKENKGKQLSVCTADGIKRINI